MEESGQIMLAIGRLEGAVNTFMQLHTQNIDRMNRIDTNIEGLDTRVRSVEKKQYTISVIIIIAWQIVQAVITNFNITKLFH